MSIPFYSDIDIKNNKIINSANPINDNDLVNKLFVNTSIENAKTELNQNILIAKNEVTEYVDSQISNIDNNFSSNVEQVIQANIVDDILSADSTKALSANMGHYLSTLIDDTNNLIVSSIANINTYVIGNQVEIGKYNNNVLYRLVVQQTIGPQPSQEIQVDLSSIMTDPVAIVNIYGTYKISTTSVDEGNTVVYNTYFLQTTKPNDISTNGIYIEKFSNSDKKLYICLGDNIVNAQQDNIILNITLEYYYDYSVE